MPDIHGATHHLPRIRHWILLTFTAHMRVPVDEGAMGVSLQAHT